MAGAGLNTVTSWTTPPVALSLAASNGSAAMIEALVAAKASVNIPTTTGATPLMAAATSGSVDAVQVLLDHDAFVNARETANGQTALMFAAWENRADVIRRLVERGAHTGLTSWVVSMNEPRLDNEGNPVPARRTRVPGANSVMGGMTALLFAARDGHLEAVRALVESGTNIDQVAGGDGSSPMVIAIANGHYTVAGYLLDEGADPNAARSSGETVLMTGARTGNAELVLALLAAGADVQGSAHFQRQTPLMWAAAEGHAHVVQVLLEAGVPPEAVQYGIDRYTNEAKRLYNVMDRRLDGREWIAGGDYSIADMAVFPWCRTPERRGVDHAEYPNFKRWYDQVAARPAVQRGVNVLEENRRTGPHSDKSWEMMFGAQQYAKR